MRTGAESAYAIPQTHDVATRPADDLADTPEAISRGQRYLAWTAGATACFVIVATFTAHIARERHERATYRQNQSELATAIGANVARQFSMTP